MGLNLFGIHLPLARAVTAEVAGSSPVVPAIHSKKLTERMDLR